jgi:hypothetical protein
VRLGTAWSGIHDASLELLCDSCDRAVEEKMMAKTKSRSSLFGKEFGGLNSVVILRAVTLIHSMNQRRPSFFEP